MRRFRIDERDNAIVNRLKCVPLSPPSSSLRSRAPADAPPTRLARSKTKREVAVDHEAERTARDSARQRAKRLAATELRNAELAVARARKADVEAKSYERLHAGEGSEAWEEDQWEASRKEGEVRLLLSSSLWLVLSF